MENDVHGLGRRKHVRVKVDAYILANLTTDKTSSERIFTTKDMSPEGIFLATGEAYPVGTILNLQVHTPTTVKPIKLEAKVKRIARDENSRVTGMGLSFTGVNEAEKKELLKHLYLAYYYTESK